MRCIFQIIVIIVTLVGCSSITSKKPENNVSIESTKKSIVVISPDIVPKLPKLRAVNWLKTIIPLVNQLAKASGNKKGEILFINSIKNNTNMSIQLTKVTDVIINAINNQHLFKLVPQYSVINARKDLGLSQEDSLVSRSKAIGLARYLQANYVLYSVISGNQEQSEIEFQLIETQSGEILWSGTNRIE